MIRHRTLRNVATLHFKVQWTTTQIWELLVKETEALFCMLYGSNPSQLSVELDPHYHPFILGFLADQLLPFSKWTYCQEATQTTGHHISTTCKVNLGQLAETERVGCDVLAPPEAATPAKLKVVHDQDWVVRSQVQCNKVACHPGCQVHRSDVAYMLAAGRKKAPINPTRLTTSPLLQTQRPAPWSPQKPATSAAVAEAAKAVIAVSTITKHQHKLHTWDSESCQQDSWEPVASLGLHYYCCPLLTRLHQQQLASHPGPIGLLSNCLVRSFHYEQTL